MFNKVILVGNLTRDCDLKYTQGGSAITNAAIATNRKYKSQDGTQREEVCFVDITFFGRTAEVANQYLKRGSKVLVEGRLKFDQWTDQNGNKRSKHSITVESLQMLGSKNETQEQNKTERKVEVVYPESHNQTLNKPTQNINVPEINIDEDEIPF